MASMLHNFFGNKSTPTTEASSEAVSGFVFMDSNPPDLYCCPITHTLMSDPVIDMDGNTFERSAIVEWLKKHKTSPITRSKMDIKDLKPNRTLRTVIEEWKRNAEDQHRREAEKNEEKQNAEINTSVHNNYTLKLETQPHILNFEEDESNELLLLAQICPSASSSRPPVDMVCVIDVSGSMGSGVVIKNEKGVNEHTALSVLDVTKHAVRTVMEVLGPKDRLSIVEYTDTATVSCPLLRMNIEGKKKAKLALELMHPKGSTNLWDGLFTGMEVVRKRPVAEQSRLSHVMLLTDGMPNIVPPRGHLPMLKRYVESHPTLNATVSTYGFGYSLDSGLLDQIAAEMNGMYAFIPDSGFVGTIFVNSLANVLSTGARNATLKFEVDSDKYDVLGTVGMDDQFKKTSWGAQLQLGNLSSDYNRNILIRLKPKESSHKISESTDSCSVTLEYLPVNTTERACVTMQNTASTEATALLATQTFARLKLFELVRVAINAFKCNDRSGKSEQENAIQNLILFGKKLQANALAKEDKYATALLEDLNGQILMGLKPDFFNKWGSHFLLSLSRAHRLEQCLNFKDPGVQGYGGPLFQSIRDTADDIFNKLPPPKPSRNPNSIRNCQTVSSMQSLNSRYAGCFDGEGKVMLPNGKFKPVKSLQKGDEVCCRNGVIAKVVCMIRTTMSDGHCEMVELKSGVKLTPWHPVYVGGEWKFPNNLGKLKLHQTPFIYNAILDKGHSLNINGVDCVTLGHHLKENKVVEHPYFGTDLVINDFKQMPGWNKGFVKMSQGYTIRDEITGLVCGMDLNKVIS